MKNYRQLSIYLLLGACLCLLPAACSSVFRAPTIKVRGIAIRTSDELDVTLAFANPNRIPLDVADFEYRATIDTFQCAQGRRSEPIHLGARDSTRADFPVRLDYENLVKSVPSLLQDSVSFHIVGSYTLPKVLGSRRLKFRRDERMALRAQIDDLLRNIFR